MKTFVLFNPLSGALLNNVDVKNLEKIYQDKELTFLDVTEMNGYSDFLKNISDEDEIVLCGGDGTLNRFVNSLASVDIKNPIYYYATGSGNDFLFDVCGTKTSEPILINEYIKSLPSVNVNGKTHKFINGVGYGIDGYCCQVGDELRKTTTKPINYTAIAIKGLLFKYKPTNAKVTVDGKVYNFKKAWIAPTMYGRYYGGGMMAAPDQSRSKDKLSFVTLHNTGKIRTLLIFPSIFKGEHIKNTTKVKVLEGKDITVEFDRPTPLQIDGETVLNVTKYHAKIS